MAKQRPWALLAIGVACATAVAYEHVSSDSPLSGCMLLVLLAKSWPAEFTEVLPKELSRRHGASRTAYSGQLR
jgi:hypothetical protein